MKPRADLQEKGDRRAMTENSITREEFKQLCIDNFMSNEGRIAEARAKRYLEEYADEIDDYVDGGFYDIQEVMEGRDSLERHGMKSFKNFCMACASAVGWNMMMSF